MPTAKNESPPCDAISRQACACVQALARVQMAKVDMLMVPTALHHYTVQEIADEERHADKVC